VSVSCLDASWKMCSASDVMLYTHKLGRDAAREGWRLPACVQLP